MGREQISISISSVLFIIRQYSIQLFFRTSPSYVACVVSVSVCSGRYKICHVDRHTLMRLQKKRSSAKAGKLPHISTHRHPNVTLLCAKALRVHVGFHDFPEFGRAVSRKLPSAACSSLLFICSWSSRSTKFDSWLCFPSNIAATCTCS